MKVKYQNENLRAKAGEHLSFIKFFSILLIFGIFLCSLSFINTARDQSGDDTFMHKLCNDHPLGLVFSITILIVDFIFIYRGNPF